MCDDDTVVRQRVEVFSKDAGVVWEMCYSGMVEGGGEFKVESDWSVESLLKTVVEVQSDCDGFVF